MQNYWLIFIIILVCFILLQNRRQFIMSVIRRKKKGKIALVMVVVVMLIGGCAFITNDSDDEVSIPTGEQNNETSYVPDICGTWTITDWIMPNGVYALSNEEIENIIGTELNFTEESIEEYTMQVITGEQLQQDYRMSASALGVEGKQLEYYSLGWEHNDVVGAHFYLISENEALVYYEGVFFQAEK